MAGVQTLSLTVLKSFEPLVDARSRILILGSMPGPEALRKRQYYGFEGNHFWTIIPALFGLKRPASYLDRVQLVQSKGIGLWDVLASCIRPGALDSAIRNPVVNNIPRLLEDYPRINAVFINGQYAFKMFKKNFGTALAKPVFSLPSTSPAHASMSIREKTRRWAVIKKYLI